MIESDIRRQILRFLSAPSAFANDLSERSRDAWLAGRELAGVRSLFPAQHDAWTGMAESRGALLLGPPGTGKTYTLSAMVLGYLRARRKRGEPCRVFVTAVTRNAVANVFEALVERMATIPGEPVPMLYLGGAPGDLASAVEVKELRNPAEVLQGLQDQSHVVTGGTVWSLFKLLEKAGSPRFDLVCIDEASQMLFSHGLLALGGMNPEGRLIVAGDDRQLAPIRDAQDEALDHRRMTGSVYTFLKSNGFPEFALTETFRLNEPLAAFPAEVFYDTYQAAEHVRNERLVLQAGWDDGLEPWERAVLNPENPVVVLLHDGPAAGTLNPFEVTLAADIARLFHQRLPAGSDFWQEQFAVITPHRSQNAAIRKSFSGEPLAADCVVETVERIQGKERDAILVSFTVADPEFAQSEAEFLFNPQRLNVMVTRARRKLVLIASRRLLEVIPPDEQVFEHAQLLREYLFGTWEIGTIQRLGPERLLVNVTVRVRTFGDEPESFAPPAAPTSEPLPELTPSLQDLYTALRQCAVESPYGSATLTGLRRRLGYLPSFDAVRQLMLLGMARLDSRNGPHGQFWSVTPQDPPVPPFASTSDVVRARVDEVIHGARQSRFPPSYRVLRHGFAWVAPDESDVLLPVLRELVAEGLLVEGDFKGQPTFDIAGQDETEGAPLPTPSATLRDVDFEILNRLEDIERGRINFGVTESWVALSDLNPDDSLSRNELLSSVHRLQAYGHLMMVDGGRIRSRMAELARELRYVKQRFRKGDSNRRPFLVRSLKIETIDRRKPVRDQALERIFTDASVLAPADPNLAKALDACRSTLDASWGAQASVAGFQSRAFLAILAAWLGISNEDAFVVTADTGSGKTEAALLPMMVGAAVDVLRGVKGCRAILVYPRIRLGANQAQRIARYLAHFNRHPGIVPLTVGLQNGEVPGDFRYLTNDSEQWRSLGNGSFSFPFFGCPECSGDLILQAGLGFDGVDLLVCTACSWSFNGWVGSKAGLRDKPPHFFLPVTESLHQWQNQEQYGSLFGDIGAAPARAVMADEIHLYAHVHGAQVGYTLRRLLARLALNGGSAPLAIGMSATLSYPERVWGELSGRDSVVALAPLPQERTPNVRGREYFYFVQPEVESRGYDIAGAATTIQALMCLAHGMRRRTGSERGFRGVVFLDSIDKLKRLHSDYIDAEEGSRLAALRTHLYDDDPATRKPRRECCGEPLSCDRFREGECWYFAATDAAQWTAQGRYRPGKALKVAQRPIFSGTGGRIEELLQSSDLIFATSTLEVGYDDPDMALVYQHYAPGNLASFIQRKGRGGRGTDDRPVTGVTLSVYSARDSWYFRSPQQMLSPQNFSVPLNVSNFFVVRGQAAATLLDAVARFRALNPRDQGVWKQNGRINVAPELLSAADRLLRSVCGREVYSLLGVADAEDFLHRLLDRPEISLEAAPGEWRKELSWIPQRLFDSINLPLLDVGHPDAKAPVSVDITQALTECAPGNMTRRYGMGTVHWIRPAKGRQVFLTTYKHSRGFTLTGKEQTGEDYRSELPLEAREGLGPEIYHLICRPKILELELGGKMSGATFTPAWAFREKDETILKNLDAPEALPITEKSRSFLRGFLVVSGEPGRATEITPTDLRELFEKVEVFRGSPDSPSTGLRATRLFWGADVVLQLRGRVKKEAGFTQIFVHPKTGRTLLHGYRVETEGVRFHINSKWLDARVQRLEQRLQSNPAEERYYRGKLLGYLVESRCAGLGVNTFEANRLSELLISVAATDEGRQGLLRLTRRWDRNRMMRLLRSAFCSRLTYHPLLSERRVERMERIFAHGRFFSTFQVVMQDVGDPGIFRAYLRSLALHGIAVRLHDLFVLYGLGDERRVLFHARLPVQFGEEAHDVITVFENGDHGDGTTRTFLENFSKAMDELRSHGLIDCPNAQEDAVVERMLTMEHRHEAWRGMDPRGPEVLEALRSELGLDGSVGVNRLLQLLHGRESVGAEHFEFFHLVMEVRRLEAELRTSMPREPLTWEVVSTAVEAARSGQAPVLAGLLAAYQKIEDATLEEGLRPEQRLADQVHRFAGRLCPDGCEACLYGGSDLMSASQARSVLSRRALESLSSDQS